MFRRTVWAGSLPLLLIASASGSAQSPAAPRPEAPVAIPEGAGQWIVRGDESRRPPFTRRPSLRYRVQALPRLTLDLVSFECAFPGGTRVEVTGFIPAQRFPQPDVALSVGGQSWAGIPNALYHARSEPGRGLPDSMLDDNLKGRNLSWPGSPAYARLSFFSSDARLPEALGSGAEVRVAFEGQQRRFPAVPAEVAGRFAQACAQVVLPGYSSR